MIWVIEMSVLVIEMSELVIDMSVLVIEMSVLANVLRSNKWVGNNFFVYTELTLQFNIFVNQWIEQSVNFFLFCL